LKTLVSGEMCKWLENNNSHNIDKIEKARKKVPPPVKVFCVPANRAQKNMNFYLYNCNKLCMRRQFCNVLVENKQTTTTRTVGTTRITTKATARLATATTRTTTTTRASQHVRNRKSRRKQMLETNKIAVKEMRREETGEERGR